MENSANAPQEEPRAEDPWEALERDLLAEVRAVIRAKTRSVLYMNDAFKGTRKDCDALKTENARLKMENGALRAELDAIRQRLDYAEYRLLLWEKFARSKNVEIKGFEETPDENLVDVVCNLGVVSGVSVTPEDIEGCRRTPSNWQPNNIVVQFFRLQKRDEFFEKASKLRLTNRDLGNTSTAPFFVNEHLCTFSKRLLGMAIKKKKLCGWMYVWTRDGKICARKSDDSEIITLKNERDLDKIQ